LKKHKIDISMDGKPVLSEAEGGAWRDNVFVERLWRSVKYEEIYLKAYDTVSAARASLSSYLTFYNARRPHTAHQGRTPDEVYFRPPPAALAA